MPMALVQQHGKPDLLIIIMSNPKWEEIKYELRPSEVPQNRPDLTSRVFPAKLQDLKDQLYKKKIFEKVVAHVHVIKFQKRGLRYVHMLVIFQPGNKLTNSDDYDKYVSAEIPDENKYPEFLEMVAKYMMHGPCGEQNPNCPCMIDGKCRFHYPRPFTSKTI